MAAPASPNSPLASNATATVAIAFGTRGSRLSRIARRGGTAASLTTGAATGTNNNEKTPSSPETEGGTKEKPSAPSASLSKANKWSALRREILPSPALMTVSAKVQHIIHMLKNPPEDRSESDILFPVLLL
ncbi:hypothetical protein PHYPSEUDO_006074 [Phytophthora pseudosyringae]|uniref:Uncharacterized protein n=1 Tax=Phytophthora pseudosyringae TaxID=221518 RepID=A0A8T1VMH2_9STRA|nr:hypothetical protein PHYPSEUDO_006074 [Phytophthora pseudosyringae]